MTEAVISKVFERPPLWDHHNEDCQNRGFVDTYLRRTTARITRQRKQKHMRQSQESEDESAFAKDATSEIEDTTANTFLRAQRRKRE